MSDPDERPLPCGSGRILMLGTVVLATAAAAVLAVGAQDVRLLRLGLVAALWAALLGAFAAARMRREISSGAHRANELRTVYQLELEREVAARREHTLTVERELRERVDQAERGEIAALRTELAAMRVSLEKLTDGQPLVKPVASQAESAHLLPVATYSHKFDDSPIAAAALGATAQATRITTTGASVQACGALGYQDLPNPLGKQFRAARSPVGSAPDSAPIPRDDDDTELHFGPGHGCQLEPGTHSRPLAQPAISGDRPWNPTVLSTPAWEPGPVHNSKHGTSSQESSESHNNGFHNNGFHNNGFHNNGFHNNGFHNNGDGIRRVAQDESVVGPQRSVNDLLAAHGVGSVP
ncbi:MAG: DUF6779 domain-containing protein, partial [Pseudonocardiaceae bacterium]